MRKRIWEYIRDRAGRFLALLGVVGFLLVALGAHLDLTLSEDSSSWAQAGVIVLETVGGALIAGVIVGFLVDLVTRHKLSRETGEEWLWALLGEDTPPPLRERAKEVISHGQAHLSVEVRCEMEWATRQDDQAKILQLRIRVLTDGVNHSRSERYIPDGPAWAMTSVDGFRTTYRKWTFEVSDPLGARASRRIEANDKAIEEHSHDRPPKRGDFEPDGSIFLYQQEMVEALSTSADTQDQAAGPGERFRLERELEVFLDPTDFFPFFVLVPTVNMKFRLMGSACRDLAIKARTGGTQLEQQRSDSGIKEFEPKAALLPGHVVILSWHPRHPEDPRVGQEEGDAAEEISVPVA